jgi:hypothetical protein
MAALMAVALSACVSNQSKQESEAAPAAPVAAEKAPEPVAAKAEDKPVCKEESAKTSKSKKTSKTKAAQPVDCVPASAAPAAPAPAPAKAAANGPYDLSKNKPVTDSTKAEAGQGTLVKGVNDWQGEISGVPAANSRFTKLKIGMAQKQVTDLIGEPTDQGAYVTGKAFIPFYFGSDRSRWEMVYKGQGRLIFSNQSGFGTGFYLTWIIHNSNEPGYR